MRHTGPADRRPDRPSGEIGEAAEHAPQVGPVSAPGEGPLSGDGPDEGELAAVTIVVNGRNVEVPEHYRVHVAEKMAHVQRYNDKIIHYDVELFHENNHRQSKLCQRVEITGTGHGPVVRAEALGPDFYAALAAALAKLKTQLRRSHDRRQVHHGHRTPTSVAEATGTLELRTMSTPPAELPRGGGPRAHRAGQGAPAEPMTVDQAPLPDGTGRARLPPLPRRRMRAASVVSRRKGFDYGVIRLL